MPPAAQSVTQTILAQPSLEGDPARFLKVKACGVAVCRLYSLPAVVQCLTVSALNPCRFQRRTGRCTLPAQR